MHLVENKKNVKTFFTSMEHTVNVHCFQTPNIVCSVTSDIFVN